MLFSSLLLFNWSVWSQSPTQQHYSTYDAAHLKPIMQHVAKNVVMVNEGKTKFQVSWRTENTITSDLVFYETKCCSSAGRQEQVLEQQADEDQPPSSAEVVHHQDHGGCSAQPSLRRTLYFISGHFTCTLFQIDPNLWRNFTSFLIKCFYNFTYKFRDMGHWFLFNHGKSFCGTSDLTPAHLGLFSTELSEH